MEQTVGPRIRATAELALIVLLISLLSALLANFAVAFLADQIQIVAKPYDLGGMIFGTALMTLAAVVALLAKRPGIVVTFAIFFFVWFFYWSGQDWAIVLKLMPYAALLPVLSVYGAWLGFRALGR